MQRDSPSQPHLAYTVRRYFIDVFHFRHVKALPRGSLVLDLGGNKIGKRGQFDIERYDLRVVYANLSKTKHPDVQADAAHIPLKDSCFDAVICSELLEHVPDPRPVLYEAHRVLRDAGKLIICTPFLYRIHGDPDDFGRYTDHYWLRALQQAGFQCVIVEPQGLFFSVVADFFKQYVNEVGVRKPFGRMSRWLVSRFQRWALRHEQKQLVQAHPFLRSFTTGYGIVAVKKQSNSQTRGKNLVTRC